MRAISPLRPEIAFNSVMKSPVDECRRIRSAVRSPKTVRCGRNERVIDWQKAKAVPRLEEPITESPAVWFSVVLLWDTGSDMWPSWSRWLELLLPQEQLTIVLQY
jgi:hypothetical protein